MGIISSYMIINYLSSLLKAATPLKVSSGRQWQAAANFDVSPKCPFSVSGDGPALLPVLW